MRWVLATLIVCGCGRFGFEARSQGEIDADGDPLIDAAIDAPNDPLVDAPPDATPDAPMSANLAAAYTLLPGTSPPSARRSSGAAVGNDDRIWIFGGFGSAGVTNELYAYTPSTGTWAAVTPTTAPPTRERHTIGWEDAADVLVVFSGYAGSFPQLTHHDELYFYVPGTNAWTQIPKAGTWPAARKDASMVWVPSLNKFLVYGGNNGSGANNRFSELWLLAIDAATPSATWTQLSPGGAAAPARSAACVGYDPVGRRLVLFGGETQDSSGTSTTYQYLVDTNVWQADTPTGTIPSARAFSACTWDPVAGRLVLYGGQDNSGNPIGGAFAYDPNAKQWAALPTASGTPPAGSSDAGATYSPALGGMFMFGGRIAQITYTNDSWRVDAIAQ